MGYNTMSFEIDFIDSGEWKKFVDLDDLFSVLNEISTALINAHNAGASGLRITLERIENKTGIS